MSDNVTPIRPGINRAENYSGAKYAPAPNPCPGHGRLSFTIDPSIALDHLSRAAPAERVKRIQGVQFVFGFCLGVISGAVAVLCLAASL